MPRKQHDPRTQHHRSSHTPARHGRKSSTTGWKLGAVVIAAVAGISSTQLLASGISLSANGAVSAPAVTAAPGAPLPEAPATTTPTRVATDAPTTDTHTPEPTPTATAATDAPAAEPTVTATDPTPTAATPTIPKPTAPAPAVELGCAAPILQPLPTAETAPSTEPTPASPVSPDNPLNVSDPPSDTTAAGEGPDVQVSPVETAPAADETSNESTTPPVAETPDQPTADPQDTATPPTPPTPTVAESPTGTRVATATSICPTPDSANATSVGPTLLVALTSPVGNPVNLTIWVSSSTSGTGKWAVVAPPIGSTSFRVPLTRAADGTAAGGDAQPDLADVQIWAEAQR